MAELSGREFLRFEVAETSQGRGYWLDQPWVDEAQRASLLKAQVLALPHVGQNEGPVFPDGSEAFLARLRELLGTEASLGVAIRAEDYSELALHSKAWRLPTLFISYIAVPFVVNILAARLDTLLPGHQTGDTAEIKLIIEGPNRKSLTLQYKGDPKELAPLLKNSIPRFIEQLDKQPDAPHQVHPKARDRGSRGGRG